MEDVLLHIYRDLPLQDIYSCSLVSKEYNKVFGNSLLWKMILDTINEKAITLWHNNPLITFKKYTLIDRLKNKLKINKTIAKLYEIKELSLSNNQLTILPAEIGQLTNLQTLYLHQNQLTTLPAEIGQLTNLQTLYLYHNQLTTLPAEIGQLTNLRILYVNNNQLTTLPVEIGQLITLRELWLQNNQLKKQIQKTLPNTIIY